MALDARYEHFRNFALRFPLEKFDGYVPSSQRTLAILLDVEQDGAICTTYLNAVGDGSVYLSNGTIIYGGSGHEDIANTARLVVAKADGFVGRMHRTDSFPLPATGERTLYLLSRDGTFLDVSPTTNPAKWPEIENPVLAVSLAILDRRHAGRTVG
jgi:hypothetical protein